MLGIRKNFLAEMLVLALVTVSLFLCHTRVNAAPKAAKSSGIKGKAPEITLTHEVVTVLTTDDQGEPLKMPSSLFLDPHVDELYVLNGGNSRFVIYGPDYFPQESLGKGRGIDAPVAGRIDKSGNILIPQAAANSHPPRLTIINSAFLPQKEIPLNGVPEFDDFSPQQIAVGADGAIYLTGLEAARVLVLTADGRFSRWWTVPVGVGGEYQAFAAAGKGGKTALIRNVAVDALGNLFLLSEETSKIYVFDSRSNFLFSFGTKGGAEGRLSRPRALAIDEHKRCIYVVDYMRHTVLIYDFSGQFRFEFGGSGWGPGWFNYPVDIVLGRQGQVIVADFFNNRVQVFDVTLPEFPARPHRLWVRKQLND